LAHVPPTVEDFRTRYPSFTGASDATVQYWMTDAERYVTTAWAEEDYAPAIMAYAAHQLALSGLDGAGGGAQRAGGMTSFRSGSLSVSFSDKAAAAWASGSWDASRYGAEFRAMLRRNRAGPIVAQADFGIDCA